MALGRTPRQTDLLRSTVDYCAERVASDSIYAILHRECFAPFPDELFADLLTDIGRRSVPPMIVAVVMVLQRIEGLSDREAATGSPSTPTGSTPPVAWTSTTPGSCTPCWWTCAPAWPARSSRTGSSRSYWTWPGRPGGGPAARAGHPVRADKNS